ncbi:anti-sigma-D factor RsdA [Rhodococcus sp. NPDC060086]|uniref:anti-sigma-D factor RsdA n=1 Tax=Rhodococcus sp. NPDC060086 TaxID=3347055 RepID=UPI003647D9F4
MGRRRGAGHGISDDFPDDGTPVDIASVRRDDALIDAISGDGPVETRSAEEYELATMLAGWRAEILAEPLPVGPDFDEVVAAVNRELGAREALAAQPPTRSKGQLRLIRPLAGAAALIAAAIGGAATVSYSAEPGDALWGVKEVVFSEQAESTMARIDTSSTLQRAEELIAEGQTEAATELLRSAEVRSTGVTNAGQRNELGDWLQRLTEEMNRIVPTLPGPLVPGVPLPPGPGAAAVPQVQPSTPGAPPQSATPQPPVESTPNPGSTVDPTILNAPTSPVETTSPTVPPTSDTSTPGESTGTTQPAPTTTVSVPDPSTSTASDTQGSNTGQQSSSPDVRMDETTSGGA